MIIFVTLMKTRHVSNNFISMNIISVIFKSINNFHKYLYIHYFITRSMLKKRAQGLSITTIIIAIIALVVIVVVVSIFTGKLNVYSSGVDELSSCENTCKNSGYFNGIASSDQSCKGVPGNTIPGTYSDVSGKNSVGDALRCCCYNI